MMEMYLVYTRLSPIVGQSMPKRESYVKSRTETLRHENHIHASDEIHEQHFTTVIYFKIVNESQ